MERERESHIRPMESLEKRNFSFFSFFLSFFLVALLIASKILSLSLLPPPRHHDYYYYYYYYYYCPLPPPLPPPPLVINFLFDKNFFFSGFFLSSEITGITWRRSWPSEMSNITRLSHTRTINSYYNL